LACWKRAGCGALLEATLLQSERLTKNEKEIIDKLRGLRIDPNPPEERISLSVDREVLKKSVRATPVLPTA